MFLAGPLHRMCEVRFKYQSILCEFVSDKCWLPQFGSRKSRGETLGGLRQVNGKPVDQVGGMCEQVVQPWGLDE